MKITAIVQTEWLIQRVMRQLQAIPGITHVYRELQTRRQVTVIAKVSVSDRYEFYFSRYSGRCGVVKFFRRHSYTEIVNLPGNHADALDAIRQAHSL